MKHLRRTARAIPVAVRTTFGALGLGLGLIAVLVVAGGLGLAIEHPSTAHALTSSTQNVVLVIELLPKLIAGVFLVALGASADWHATLVRSAAGRADLLSVAPWSVLLAAVPLAVAAYAGYRTARRVSTTRGACRSAFAVTATFAASALLLAAVANGTASVDPLLGAGLHVSLLEIAVLGVLWGLAGGGLGAWLALRTRDHQPTAPARLALPALAAVGIPLAAVALSAGSGRAPHVPSTVALLTAPAPTPAPVTAAKPAAAVSPAASRKRSLNSPATRQELAQIDTGSAPTAQGRALLRDLRRISKDTVHATWNPTTNRPSFVVAHIPVTAVGAARGQSAEQKAQAFVDHFPAAFGVGGAASALKSTPHVAAVADPTGERHAYFQQVYHGVEVDQGTFSMDLDRSGKDITAVSNGLVPDVHPATTTPKVPASQAATIVRKALPKAMLQAPKLVIVRAPKPAATDTLDWSIDAQNGASGHGYRYLVDAVTGRTLDVEPLDSDGLNRFIYDLHNRGAVQLFLEPANLARSEAQNDTGNREVDAAYNTLGSVYNYYRKRFGRDSWNGQGVAVRANVNWHEQNAAWAPTIGQFYFGTGIIAGDVGAHEWGHAVAQFSPAQEFGGIQKGETGGLSEGWSDAFGFDYSGNPIIGSTVMGALGVSDKRGIRNMANPADPSVLNPGPANVSQYQGCSESHTAAGIPDHAFYLAATRLGSANAAQAWYRALTTDLRPDSKFNDAMLATYKAAGNMYGWGSYAQYLTYRSWADIGVDGRWRSNEGSCRSFFFFFGCAVKASLMGSDDSPTRGDTPSDNSFSASDQKTIDTLHQVRDDLMPKEPAGRRYKALYEDNTARISQLVIEDPQLRAQAATVIDNVTPKLSSLLDGEGNQTTLTPGLVNQINGFLSNLASADEQDGGGQLANTIHDELQTADLPQLEGKTMSQVLGQLNADVQQDGSSSDGPSSSGAQDANPNTPGPGVDIQPPADGTDQGLPQGPSGNGQDPALPDQNDAQGDNQIPDGPSSTAGDSSAGSAGG